MWARRGIIAIVTVMLAQAAADIRSAMRSVRTGVARHRRELEQIQ